MSKGRKNPMANATQGKAHVVVVIDVSKRSLDICLLPEGETFVVSNDRQGGVDELLSTLNALMQDRAFWRSSHALTP
jgi:hypothetical protein